MSMGQQLYNLLKHCTARIFVPGTPEVKEEKDEGGSGFFVAPGLLLTCRHVVKFAESSPEKIKVFWNREPGQAPNEKIDVDADWNTKPYKVREVIIKGAADLALLRVEIDADHPCVWLTKEEAPPGTKLYSFGYPVRNLEVLHKPTPARQASIRKVHISASSASMRDPAGEPANYLLEGKTGDAIGLLKFKDQRVIRGQSGSPLLDENTGYVCAVIIRAVGGAEELGGLAISAATVLQVFPEIETLQQLFHRKDQRWMDCLWEDTALTKEDPRLQLLQKVRVFRIKQFFEEHLGPIAYIPLGLSEFPEAIENPLRLPKQEADQAERMLRLNTTITQVYAQSIDSSLLILGEPGGGKTTMLLELTRNLLDRARLNNSHPIPVVFNLSSWTTRHPSFADWLIEELHHTYDISPTQGKSWIESNKVLPLLDGLDEVRQNTLTACVKAINTYRQEHGFLPTVVSSNRDAYLSQLARPQSARLQMRSAVVVQPLTTEQIDECLESAGPQLERLRRARLKDSVMQELLTRPLMLNILMAIFRDMPPDEDLLTSGSSERQTQQIFAKYVQRMLKDHIANSRYTAAQAIHWLSYLAKQLYREGPKELFSVENLQPGWLRNANNFLYHLYNWCIGLIYGLAFGLPIILVGGQLVVGGQPSSLPLGIFIWLVFGFVCGILYPIRSMRIRPAEAITWSWKDFRPGFVLGFVLGFVPGTILGTILSTSMGWPEGLSLVNGLLYYLETVGIHVGIILGIILGTIFGLFRGLFPKQLIVRENLLPNSGTRRSMKNGVIFGLLLCPAVMMVVAFVFWRLAEYNATGALEQTLVIGLIIGLYVGLIFALFKGLGAFVQHYLLRFFLWSTNCLPWNLVHFLDEAARRHLLSKVGGNYIFWHASLFQYFVTFNELASTTPKKASIFHGKPRLSLMGQLFTGPLPDTVSRIRLAWQITLRVLLALLIIGTAGLALGFWKPAQPSSSYPPEPVTPTSPVVTVESSPRVIINSTGLLLPGTLTEFSSLSSGDVGGMVIGPDGNLWFTNNPGDYASGRSLIGLITPSGKITEFALTDDMPNEITTGPDGNLWFTENYHIGRITPSGKITEFALPTEGEAYGITKGPDGNLWFAEMGVDKIGRITPTGNITEFTLPTNPDTNGSEPEGITTGPGGNLWFTESNASTIGRITPTGKITEFVLPTAQSAPVEITAGPDGNLWFTESGAGKIGRITPAGKITEFVLSTLPLEITAGPDGNLWFTDSYQLGRITPSGKITEFTLPSTTTASTTISLGYLVFGPKGRLWFSDKTEDAIGYITSTQFNA